MVLAATEALVVGDSVGVVVEVVIAVSKKVAVAVNWVVADCGDVGKVVLIPDDGFVLVVVTVVVVVEGVVNGVVIDAVGAVVVGASVAFVVRRVFVVFGKVEVVDDGGVVVIGVIVFVVVECVVVVAG